MGRPQLRCDGASAAVASAATLWSPKPSSCMNHGVMPLRWIVQRTYLASPPGPLPALSHAPPLRALLNSTVTSAEAMASP